MKQLFLWSISAVSNHGKNFSHHQFVTDRHRDITSIQCEFFDDEVKVLSLPVQGLKVWDGVMYITGSHVHIRNEMDTYSLG
jgi:hypothetical protein